MFMAFVCRKPRLIARLQVLLPNVVRAPAVGVSEKPPTKFAGLIVQVLPARGRVIQTILVHRLRQPIATGLAHHFVTERLPPVATTGAQPITAVMTMVAMTTAVTIIPVGAIRLAPEFRPTEKWAPLAIAMLIAVQRHLIASLMDFRVGTALF